MFAGTGKHRPEVRIFFKLNIKGLRKIKARKAAIIK